jgi:hypothetical protein
VRIPSREADDKAITTCEPAVFVQDPVCTDKLHLGDILLNAHLARGPHTLTFDPSTVRSVVKETSGPIIVGNFTGNVVGWYQREDSTPFGTSADVARIGQTAARFDISSIHALPAGDIDSVHATLTFDERAAAWTDADGKPQHKPDGCVVFIGLATSDWTTGALNSLFSNRTIASTENRTRDWIAGEKVMRNRWDVTDNVRSQLRRPTDAALKQGYVIRGGLDSVDADDDTSCMSNVDHLKLEISYIVE